jgi:uracil-DNA glycosylase
LDETLRRELELLRDLGFTELDLGGTESPSGGVAPRASARAAESSEATESLGRLRHEAMSCERCALSPTRTTVVFGTGNPQAELMFIGEAPGRDEDLAGEPFVGRAGKLLTDIIEAMTLDRDEVYIANVIKCRPPGNRNPEPEEIESCRPYLRRQIELVSPRVIVTLGKFAYQSLLDTTAPISQSRGRWQRYDGVKVMPTYHPAYLLRNPSAKREVWEDMKKVMHELGITLPAKPRK